MDEAKVEAKLAREEFRYVESCLNIILNFTRD
jgi:hypothetical protein